MQSNNANQRPFLIFGSPLIEQAEIDEVVACMKSSWLGTGPRVAQFERDFAAYQGLQPSQVAAVNSCTAALHVSMIAAGLPPGSEVIAYFGPCRSVIPEHAGQGFRSMSVTDFGPCRSG